MVKEYGRHEVSSIQVLIFVFVCVVVFPTSIFFFRTLSIISLARFFLIKGYPFKKSLYRTSSPYLSVKCLKR